MKAGEIVRIDPTCSKLYKQAHEAKPGARLFQNRYFSANCTILGSRELVIRPNTAMLKAVLGFPGRKLFVTL